MIVISNLLTFDAKHLTPLILTFLNWILLWELMLGHRLFGHRPGVIIGFCR